MRAEGSDAQTGSMAKRLVLGPSEGKQFSFGTIETRILLTGDDTAGAFGLIESPIGAGVLAGPLHVHRNEDGYWYVLEGEFAAQIGERVIREGPGALIYAPRGIPHTYWNPGSEPARYLELFTPAGLERYFEKLAGLLSAGAQETDLEAVVELGKTFGLEMQFESLPELIERHGVKGLPGIQT